MNEEKVEVLRWQERQEKYPENSNVLVLLMDKDSSPPAMLVCPILDTMTTSFINTLLACLGCVSKTQ